MSPFGFGDGPCCSTQGLASGFSLPCLQDMSFVDGFLVDEESMNLTHERNGGDLEKNLSCKVVSKREGKEPSGRRVKSSSSSSNLVKGQWTAEEDR